MHPQLTKRSGKHSQHFKTMKKIALIISLLGLVASFGATVPVYVDSITGEVVSPVSFDPPLQPVDEVAFDTSAIPGDYAEGTMRWNQTDHTVEIDTGLNAVTIQLGQEIVIKARNNTGSTITNGSVVRITGATGNRPTIALAQANAVATASETIAVATQDITNNSDGFVTSFGAVRDIDTSSFSAGDIIWLSDLTPGGLTATMPAIPVRIGVVTVSNANNGVIAVDLRSDVSTYELASDPSAVGGFDDAEWRTDLDVYSKTESDNKLQAIIEGVESKTANLTVADGVIQFRMPFSMSLSEVRISATEAPVGSKITAHLEKNGVNILSTDLSIDEGEKTSRTAQVETVIGEDFVTDDDEISLNVSQIGSTTSGKGLTLYLIGNQIESDQSFLNQYGDNLAVAYSVNDFGNRSGVADSVINPVLRARRSLDSSLKSFKSTDITDGTFVSWVGSSAGDNAFTQTYYDLSGNLNHATQLTDSDQPPIVTDGVIETDSNGNIASIGDGSNYFFNLTSGVVMPGEFTIFFIAEYKTAGIRTILGNQSSVNPRIRVENSGNLEITNDSGTEINLSIAPALVPGTTYMITIDRDQSNVVRLYINGALQASSNTLAGNITFNRILARDGGNNPWDGAFSSLLIYNGEAERFEIEEALDGFFF